MTPNPAPAPGPNPGYADAADQSPARPRASGFQPTGLEVEDLVDLAELALKLHAGKDVCLSLSPAARAYAAAALTVVGPVGGEPWAAEVTEGRTWLGLGEVSKVSPKSARLVGLVLDDLAAHVRASAGLGHHHTVTFAHDLVLALSLSLSQARQQRDAALRGYQERSALALELQAQLSAAHRALAHNAGTAATTNPDAEARPFGELAAGVLAGVGEQLERQA